MLPRALTHAERVPALEDEDLKVLVRACDGESIDAFRDEHESGGTRSLETSVTVCDRTSSLTSSE